MPILKTYDIKTIEEVKKIHALVEETQENNKYKTYTPKNIMLVRTTHEFPTNRIIKPLSNCSYIVKNEKNFIYNGLYYDLDKNILEQLGTYELYYRSTIHFAENGIVSSHDYGNFDNQPFIILEPLYNQLGKANFRNFAGQDTFIKGNVALSEEAIIIIREEDYIKIKQNHPEIENFNVVLYKGIDQDEKERYIKENEYNLPEFYVNDKRAVVEIILMELGYTPELIGNHYIIDSPTSAKVRSINELLEKKYKALAEAKHKDTDEYKEDFEKNLKITDIFNKMLLDFILRLNNIEEQLTISNYTAFRLIELIGLDKLIENINIFNKIIEEMHNENLLPTSEELLNGNVPKLFDYYINNNISTIKK